MKKFLNNLKQYVNYIMKVNFKDLLVNVVILGCIVLLSVLVYLPVGLIEDLIRSFIVIWMPFEGVPAILFTWTFSLISFICAVIAFIFLFNKRFEDIEAFKEQVSNPNKSVNKKMIESNVVAEDDKIELPKEKDNKKGA